MPDVSLQVKIDAKDFVKQCNKVIKDLKNLENTPIKITYHD